jgi:sugar porter (SP) family MFS transporter
MKIYFLFSVFVVALASFLFGFNTAIISGALLYITDEFHLTILNQGILVSSIILGAILSALIGGTLADILGRKISLFITALIFLVGTTLIYFTDEFSLIVVGRFIQGMGVGFSSILAPLYFSEISPIKYRGAVVSINQLSIVLGVVIAYLINYSYVDWRDMFAFAFLPSILLFFGLFFISETPSFLMIKGKIKKAEKVNSLLKREEGILEEKKKKISFKHLINSENKNFFIVGIGISIIQQITGINVVVYYAPKIFKMANSLNHSKAILATLSIGIVKLIFTIFAIFLVDRVGRRKLLLIGILGMAASMFFLGIYFIIPKFFIGVFSITAYVCFFAISLGPIAWLLISEIFPLSIRGKAMGIAAFFNWGFNYLIALSFLPLMHFLGSSNIFFLFSLVAILSYFFIKRKVPETKNKSFLEIQKFFKK